MFLVTVSFKNCEHQLVLRYKTEESMQAQYPEMLGSTTRTPIDDYGAVVCWEPEDVVSIQVVNLPTALKGRNAEDKIRARAHHDLKQEMLNDPTLEFIVDRSPFFGRK